MTAPSKREAVALWEGNGRPQVEIAAELGLHSREDHTMLEQLARLTKQILAIVRQEEVCRRLMSVPGVGTITALPFRATIDRPDRFRRSRDVGAHLGLTPARY